MRERERGRESNIERSKPLGSSRYEVTTADARKRLFVLHYDRLVHAHELSVLLKDIGDTIILASWQRVDELHWPC
jgi:hypothetical protein